MVGQSRDQLQEKMAEYRQRKAAWEQRMVDLQNTAVRRGLAR
jgi:hypothetical protein